MASLDNLQSLTHYGAELAIILAILGVVCWDLIAKDGRSKVLGSVGICLAALGYSAFASLTALHRHAASAHHPVGRSLFGAKGSRHGDRHRHQPVEYRHETLMRAAATGTERTFSALDGAAAASKAA